MIKTIILFIAISFQLLAQDGVTRFYVNTERTGPGTYNGASWATAWNLTNSVDYWGSNGTGIVWSSISAGDTIFFSGGTDTVFVEAEGAYGTVFRWSGTSNFSSGLPLVILEGKHSPNPTGHDGEVVFVNTTDKANTAWIRQIINIRIEGFTFQSTSAHTNLQVGTGNYPAEDSMIVFEDCHIIGVGLGGLVGVSAKQTTFKKCLIENLDNDYPNDQDAFGFNTGTDHIIDSCVVITRNGYEVISDTNLMDAGGMTVTDSRLTDTDLDMVTDYHVGNSIWVNGYYLQITSNTNNTFYGDEWAFDVITQSNPAAVVVTTNGLQDNNTESHNAGTLVGAVIELASGDTMAITSNSGTSFTGSGGWYPDTSPASNQTYIIRGGGLPFDSLSWTMGGAHRDIAQISNMATGVPSYFQISNSLLIDTKEEGTGWNNLIYNYSDLVTPHISFLFYNNIIVSRKTKTSPGAMAIGSNYGEGGYTRWNSLEFLQNTIIIKGEAGVGFMTTWAIDTLVAKNNLIIIDTTAGYFYSPENSSGLFSSVVKDIDHNVYAQYGGITGSTDFGSSNLGTPDWDTWRTYDNYDGSGVDSNSLVYNSTAVSFDNKYGLTREDYYTGIGRDAGENLLAAYPFLRYDAKGNERGYGSGWDIGALEFVGGETPIDSTPSNASFSINTISSAELNTSYTGNIYELADFDSAYFHIDRGWYNINGGAWKSSDEWTKVYPTNDIAVRDTSSGSYSTSQSIVATIGTETDTWTVTTKSEPPASGSGWILKGADGYAFRMSDGKLFRTADTTTTPPIQYDSIPPNPPTSFVAVGGSYQTQFQTNWTNPTATDLDSIRYYEGSSNDTTTMVWIVSLPATTGYLRTGRTSNTTYWAAVKAVDDSGNVSYFSNVDSATTLTTPESGTPLANLDLAYLTQSFAHHLYDHSTVGNSGATTMQAEMTAYNETNVTDGSITRITPDYPDCGDMIWDWNQVFFGGTLEGNTSPNQNVITEYAIPSTYSIIQVTIGFNSGDIWFPGWYVDITDTLNYPQSHIENVYKYWIRNMVSIMEQYPDKYWILWNIPPVTVGSSSGTADALRHANFNVWMTDTLQAGLDSYGAFPSNVYIFDVYTLLKDPSSNFMNPAYADGPTDSHPNEDAQDVVAPIYIQEVFDNARAYRRP